MRVYRQICVSDSDSSPSKVIFLSRHVFTYHIPLGETRHSKQFDFRCPQASLQMLLAVISCLVNDETAILWWWKQ